MKILPQLEQAREIFFLLSVTLSTCRYCGIVTHCICDVHVWKRKHQAKDLINIVVSVLLYHHMLKKDFGPTFNADELQKPFDTLLN